MTLLDELRAEEAKLSEKRDCAQAEAGRNKYVRPSIQRGPKINFLFADREREE